MEQEGKRRRFAWEEDENFLRKVEINVLIPKKIREKARVECKEYVDAFTECCSSSGIGMVVKCRKQNTTLKACLTKYYHDPEFFEMCKKEYLEERKNFRETGIKQKDLPATQSKSEAT
ncbi:putative COX assembly mitochondrial protein-like [Apostichopus japonicus]|uniref:COX assembly mitochondrial protein n=1 Tax=Stichopus japonicus TaxID=307972 RepID=A0A2G8JWX0_STIJA|nr:putative COX assembly mitochondrial protein-like [Apostichopus japonicus]